MSDLPDPGLPDHGASGHGAIGDGVSGHGSGNGSAAPRDLSRWRMGSVDLDESTLELRVQGQLVAIERKPLELLMWLLRRPGEVVTKEELFDALWAGRVVTESVLTKCIAKLRHALGEEGPAALKTVHGFGYRLVAPVERLEVQLAASRPEPPLLRVGDRPPLRPMWPLSMRFEGSRAETWLAVHEKSGEKRVFKFAADAAGLARVKREITLHRLLRETLGPRDDFVRMLDWNLQEAPYFVEFEHCAGGSLHDWLAARGGSTAVPLAQRMEWVAQAAVAVAAAHSAGVLHKDIKPSNLLLDAASDEAPRLRVADFGSGRLLQADLLQALQITQLGFTRAAADEGDSGTWAYLAPEVVAGQSCTVHSDVFALGVLLYQLAVGDLRRPLAPGWEREINDELLRQDIAACCDHDPAQRLGDAGLLAQRLRDRSARQAAAVQRQRAEAAMEEARRALERARARRGWLWGLTTMASVAAVGMGALFLQVRDARDAADRSAAQARAVNEFLVNDLIGAANPQVSGRPDVTVRQVLDAAASQIDNRFANQADVAAAMHLALAESRLGIGQAESAAQGFAQAGQVATDPALRLRAATGAGRALLYLGRDAEALAVLAAAQPRLAQVGPAQPGPVLMYEVVQAAVQSYGPQRAQAIQSLLSLQGRVEAEFGPDSSEALELLTNLGSAQLQSGAFDAGLASMRQARARAEAKYGPGHPRALLPSFGVAEGLRSGDRHEQALAEFRQAHQRALAVLGQQHLLTIQLATGVASTLPPEARQVEGLAHLEALLPVARQSLGAEHEQTLTIINNLAQFAGDAGQRERERALYRELIPLQQRALGPEHLNTLVSYHNLGRSHARSNQFDQALPWSSRAHDGALKTLGEDHPFVCAFGAMRAAALAELGQRDQARTLAKHCAKQLTRQLGAEHESTRSAVALLGRL